MVKVAKGRMIWADADWYSLIFLFMFSDRTEGNLLSDGLLFPLDVIWHGDVDSVKTLMKLEIKMILSCSLPVNVHQWQ